MHALCRSAGTEEVAEDESIIAEAGRNSLFDGMRGDSAPEEGLSKDYQLPLSVVWSGMRVILYGCRYSKFFAYSEEISLVDARKSERVG